MSVFFGDIKVAGNPVRWEAMGGWATPLYSSNWSSAHLYAFPPDVDVEALKRAVRSTQGLGRGAVRDAIIFREERPGCDPKSGRVFVIDAKDLDAKGRFWTFADVNERIEIGASHFSPEAKPIAGVVLDVHDHKLTWVDNPDHVGELAPSFINIGDEPNAALLSLDKAQLRKGFAPASYGVCLRRR